MSGPLDAASMTDDKTQRKLQLLLPSFGKANTLNGTKSGSTTTPTNTGGNLDLLSSSSSGSVNQTVYEAHINQQNAASPGIATPHNTSDILGLFNSTNNHHTNTTETTNPADYRGNSSETSSPTIAAHQAPPSSGAAGNGSGLPPTKAPIHLSPSIPTLQPPTSSGGKIPSGFHPSPRLPPGEPPGRIPHDDNNNNNEHPHHYSPPTTHSTTTPPVVVCNNLLCQISQQQQQYPLVAVMAVLLLLSLLCAWWWRQSRQADLGRGEYRAVAAHYADNAFDDAFADDFSAGSYDDDDDAGPGDDHEDDDNGWSGTNKRCIEMKTLDKEENGGLTLEEMNG